jgi:hypothetical protein
LQLARNETNAKVWTNINVDLVGGVGGKLEVVEDEEMK